MNLSLSQRVASIKPSPTLAITARAAQMRAAGKDVIGLGAGEPDFDTPEPIKQAAIEAIHQGKTRYTAVDGTPSLKQAVIDKFQRDNSLSYTPDQILVSSGGKQSFFNLAQALLDPGDEVIIPAPYWVSYPDMVLLASGVPVILPAKQKQKFKLLPEQLEQAITKKTKLFILNSPSNPTGMLYSQQELAAFGEVLLRHPQVMIATDDMYEHIRWQEEPFYNLVMACPALYDRTVVMNGVSKTYAMTGWRIGYAGGPAKLIEAMKKVQSQSTSNPCSISQAAAQAALEGDSSFIGVMTKAFQKRHDYVVATLNTMPGVDCLATDGTFYCFPDIREVISSRNDIANDLALAERLIEEVGVALIPGSAFGAPDHIRLSIATDMESLQKAMQRIGDFLQS